MGNAGAVFSRWPPDLAAWSPADWSAAGQVATAVVAVVAAFFAYGQVRQARKVREEKDQPYVVVYFELSEVWANAVNLSVENIGHTIARNVKISFDRPLESKARTGDLNEAKILKDGLLTMPPGMKLSTLFDLTHERYKTDLPMSYMVEVSFKGIRGRKQTLRYPLEMDIYYGLEGFRAQGIHQIAKSLSGIEETIGKWTGRRGRLNIWSKDEDYLDWDEQWQNEHGGSWPTLARPYPAGRPTPSKFAGLREPAPVRLFWRLVLPIYRQREAQAERREQERLEKAGRPDLALARRSSFGPGALAGWWSRVWAWARSSPKAGNR